MLICPYKAQVKRVVERFEAEGVQYHRCLTVDSAQGSESIGVKCRYLYAHEATPWQRLDSFPTTGDST